MVHRKKKNKKTQSPFPLSQGGLSMFSLWFFTAIFSESKKAFANV